MLIAIPIKDKDDLGSAIVKARDSTYMSLPTGTTAYLIRSLLYFPLYLNLY